MDSQPRLTCLTCGTIHIGDTNTCEVCGESNFSTKITFRSYVEMVGYYKDNYEELGGSLSDWIRYDNEKRRLHGGVIGT